MKCLSKNIKLFAEEFILHTFRPSSYMCKLTMAAKFIIIMITRKKDFALEVSYDSSEVEFCNS